MATWSLFVKALSYTLQNPQIKGYITNYLAYDSHYPLLNAVKSSTYCNVVINLIKSRKSEHFSPIIKENSAN